MAAKGYAWKDWYSENKQYFVDLFGPKEAELWLRVLGTTSQRNTLTTNVTQALKAIRRYKETGDILEQREPLVVRHDTGEVLKWRKPRNYLQAMESQLRQALEGRPISGRKIRNFVHALNGDPQAIVIDMWMAKAWGIPPRLYKGAEYYSVSEKQYDYCEDGTRQVALFFDVAPRDVQAMVWTGLRGEEYDRRGKTYVQTYKESVAARLRYSLIYEPYEGTNYRIGPDNLIYITP